MSNITEQLLRGTSKGVGAKAALALEDGTVFFGTACGAAGEAFGEICFNTSLEGYLEVISDPSYAGQIITLTFPQIGNYGVNLEDAQSGKPALRGLVVRDMCATPSNWRSDMALGEYLERNGVVARARSCVTCAIMAPSARSSPPSTMTWIACWRKCA